MPLELGLEPKAGAAEATVRLGAADATGAAGGSGSRRQQGNWLGPQNAGLQGAAGELQER